jgi:hypothetical protein
MTNQITKIIINLDKPRQMIFDLNAMAAFEESTGKSAFDIGKSVTATNIRALLWATLMHEDDTLTIKDVGKMIHPGNMQEISEKITKLIQVSTETSEESQAKGN